MNNNSFKEEESLLKELCDPLVFNDLKDFFDEYIVEDRDFIEKVFLYGNVPRRMLNSIRRLVTLANDMEKIRKGKDSLKVFFYVVCIESLYIIKDPKTTMNKDEMVRDFFKNYISLEDKALIKRTVHKKRENEIHKEKKIDFLGTNKEIEVLEDKLELTQFAQILIDCRNTFVHEGIYWGFSFAKDSPVDVPVDLQSIRYMKRTDKYYQVELTYEQFRRICINGFIRLVQEYFDSLIKGF
ncbi:MAG TPA: hypothetical protein GX691_00620 [Clostridia bacterium]|nr:hypothetical protein [Clostridia bacterium]